MKAFLSGTAAVIVIAVLAAVVLSGMESDTAQVLSTANTRL
jgi:hypothetical protein